MSMDISENWRSVPGHEDCYEVSDRGHVRSIDRHVVGRWGLHRRRGLLLRQSVDKDGYLSVALSRNGIARTMRVHRLVLMAFVGPAPEGAEVLHRDGNPANNVVSNLSWGTSSDNAYDRVRHGTHRNSRKTHCPHGHIYDAVNTRMDGGSRRCKTCKRRRDSEYKARRLAAGRSLKEEMV